MNQLRHIPGLRKSTFEMSQPGEDDYLIAPSAKESRKEAFGRRLSDKKIGKKKILAGVSAGAHEDAPVMEGQKRNGAALPGLARAQGNEFNFSNDEQTVKSNTEKALRVSQRELRQLSEQLLTIQEQERQRIAADLHDGIGQSLSLIRLSMESVERMVISGEKQKAVESIQWLMQKVKEAMTELRRTTSDLRPSMLDDLGILPTLTWFFREFELVCSGKTIEKHVDVNEGDIPTPLKQTIFRILQEAMNNIVKHAHADSVRVSLKRVEDILELSIEDNGTGMDQASLAMRKGNSNGFGLLTMKERARSSNGIFEIQSAPGQGTRIKISWRIKVNPLNMAIAKCPK